MIDRAGPGVSTVQSEVAMIPGQSMAVGAPTVSPNGTAPRCEHLDGLAPIGRQSDDCRECQRRQDALRGDRPPGRRQSRAGSHVEMVLRTPASRLNRVTDARVLPLAGN